MTESRAPERESNRAPGWFDPDQRNRRAPLFTMNAVEWGGSVMTTGEFAYLALVLGALVVFCGVLATVSFGSPR